MHVEKEADLCTISSGKSAILARVDPIEVVVFCQSSVSARDYIPIMYISMYIYLIHVMKAVVLDDNILPLTQSAVSSAKGGACDDDACDAHVMDSAFLQSFAEAKKPEDCLPGSLSSCLPWLPGRQEAKKRKPRSRKPRSNGSRAEKPQGHSIIMSNNGYCTMLENIESKLATAFNERGFPRRDAETIWTELYEENLAVPWLLERRNPTECEIFRNKVKQLANLHREKGLPYKFHLDPQKTSFFLHHDEHVRIMIDGSASAGHETLAIEAEIKERGVPACLDKLGSRYSSKSLYQQINQWKIHVQVDCRSRLVAWETLLEVMKNPKINKVIPSLKITHCDPTAPNVPDDVFTAEVSPSIVLYCSHGAQKCIETAYKVAQAFAIFQKQDLIIPDLARPPRFNYRISDVVYIANGDAGFKLKMREAKNDKGQNLCTKNDMAQLFWPEPEAWPPSGALEDFYVMGHLNDLRKEAKRNPPPPAFQGYAVIKSVQTLQSLQSVYGAFA